jgi:MarR family transcriptional regulator for hemolysin
MPRAKRPAARDATEPGAPSTSASVHREFMFNVAQTHKQWRRAVDRLLSPLGLSQAQWLPLLHLAHAPEAMRQKDLAQALGLDSSSVVRIVDGLVAKGWVLRQDDTDRRVKKLQLTAAGAQQVEQVEGLIDDARAQLLTVVAPQELAACTALMQRLMHAMNELHAATPPPG